MRSKGQGPSFPFLSGDCVPQRLVWHTVSAEASLKCGPMRIPIVCYKVCELVVCDAALNPVQVCIVYLRGVVLFVFTVSSTTVSFTGCSVRLSARDHVRPAARRELYCLPLAHGIKFKVALLMYMAHNRLSPLCIS